MRAKILFLGGLALLVSSGVRAQDRPNRATATPMPAVERPRDIPKNMQPYFVVLFEAEVHPAMLPSLGSVTVQY